MLFMSIFEVETWRVIPGKEKEHEEALRVWMTWVREHKMYFPEWKTLRYFVKYIAGEETDRHIMIWEYESLADYEKYKNRRADYEGPYAEYQKVDPYHKGVFDKICMSVEVWKENDRDLWIE
jgi:hypothetical protein